MAKPYLLEFYTITILLLLRLISCAEVSFCNQTPFPELCNTSISPGLDSREIGIDVPMSQLRQALKDYLTKSQTMFDDQAKEAWKDCFELYKDVINHLNPLNMNQTNGEKWLAKAIFNHQTCLNGFNDLKVLIDVLSGNKPPASMVSARSVRGMIQLAEGATIQANLAVAQDGSEVWGLGFIAKGITFENTAGPEYGQAIALLSASDFSVFYRCSFKGFQDTLCLFHYRQFYRECDIYGTVDFIFGDASAILQNCNIYVRTPLPGQQNTITAQGRVDQTSTTGFVIHNSRISSSPNLIPANWQVMTYLGRPWRDYSRVVYIKCDFDIDINPAGWLSYHGNSAAFERVYYAEYMNKGIGANTVGRVTWPGYHALMSSEEAEPFSVRNFFAGESWIPSTGVPFYYGI
uniref:Pectinesterase n=1 Tax=Tanacetum cinerariifolium TaxID=118510 RepID=A0A6L2JIR1_TANCI|nr:probable pectinesterase/pectinesterase inhibitor 6 [Tanacetum cinerariifolium]